MTIDEIAADIIKTYAETPEHLTGPPLVNWLPLWDESLSDWAWLARLRNHPSGVSETVKKHNTRARACRVADIKALAEKYRLDLRTVKMAIPTPRISSATGGPVPAWLDAWRMVREVIGDGPHSAKTIQIELEAVGMTNVQYHINTESYPAWVKVKVVKRGDARARRVFSFEGGADV